jgi:hypothetical protein
MTFTPLAAPGVFVVVVTVALPFGCGDVTTQPVGGRPQAGGALALADLDAQVRRVLCEKVDACCSPAERLANEVLGPDRRTCERELDGEATLLLGDISASVSQGRVIYHADRMASCLEKIGAATCAEVKMPAGDVSVVELCEEAFEARVPVGGACSDSWDCVGGWCAGDQGGLRDRCVAHQVIGQECDEGPECASGVCFERACIARPAGSGDICKIGAPDLGK